MTNSEYPWEPPLAGTEAEHLVGALDRLRTTFRWKADDLDAAGLQLRIGASSLTIGGLLKHLARAEDQMFTTKLSGTPLGAPWDAADWDADPDWDFNSAADDTPEQLYAIWDDTIERSARRLTAALADGGLTSSCISRGTGRQLSLRRLVCDLIEEYGRHTGHADLLREAVDGGRRGPGRMAREKLRPRPAVRAARSGSHRSTRLGARRRSACAASRPMQRPTTRPPTVHHTDQLVWSGG